MRHVKDPVILPVLLLSIMIGLCMHLVIEALRHASDVAAAMATCMLDSRCWMKYSKGTGKWYHLGLTSFRA